MTTEIFKFDTSQFGSHNVSIWGAKKVYTCGINWSKELQIQVWTSDNERSGYIIYYNLVTQKKRFERIIVSYIDADSAKKYGRQVIRETLPIIATA